jgi:hypothetical protein
MATAMPQTRRITRITSPGAKRLRGEIIGPSPPASRSTVTAMPLSPLLGSDVRQSDEQVSDHL